MCYLPELKLVLTIFQIKRSFADNRRSDYCLWPLLCVVSCLWGTVRRFSRLTFIFFLHLPYYLS